MLESQSTHRVCVCFSEKNAPNALKAATKNVVLPILPSTYNIRIINEQNAIWLKQPSRPQQFLFREWQMFQNIPETDHIKECSLNKSSAKGTCRIFSPRCFPCFHHKYQKVPSQPHGNQTSVQLQEKLPQPYPHPAHEHPLKAGIFSSQQSAIKTINAHRVHD
jgi:hypothetical protein